MADGLGTPGPPAGPGVVSALDHRLDQGAWLALTTGIMDVRTGVPHGPGTTALVTGTSATGTMTYAIAAHHWVTSRGVNDGVYVGTTEAAQTVATTAAPGSNSRIDVIWEKQQDQYSTLSADATSAPQYGVTQGTAAVSPTKPTIPVGALELATSVVAVGATSTNGANVTITNTARLTAARGAPIPVRNTTERDALTTYPGLHVIRLDNGGKLERWVSGSTWTTYDALQVPIRSQRLAVTAFGDLTSGSSVNVVAPEALPAAPHGSGVPYRIRVAGQIRVSIPAGLGATLSVTVGATTYEIDRITNGGSSTATYTLKGEEVFYIASDTAQTVTVFATSLAGTTVFTATGHVIIETAPYTAL